MILVRSGGARTATVGPDTPSPEMTAMDSVWEVDDDIAVDTTAVEEEGDGFAYKKVRV